MNDIITILHSEWPSRTVFQNIQQSQFGPASENLGAVSQSKVIGCADQLIDRSWPRLLEAVGVFLEGAG